MNWKVLFWVILILFLLLSTCDMRSSSSSSGISTRQIEILNDQIDTLHEEIAAANSPGGWAVLALVISIAVPLVLAVVLLLRAEKTALHNDEIIRQVARTGLMTEMIDAEKLLNSQSSTGSQVQRVLPSLRRALESEGEHKKSSTATSEREDEPAD